MTLEQFEKSVKELEETITNSTGQIKNNHCIHAHLINGDKQAICGAFGCSWFDDGMVYVRNPFAGTCATFHVESVVRLTAE